MRRCFRFAVACHCAVATIGAGSNGFARDKARIQSFEAPGNLELTHKPDCMALDQARSEYTPIDLYSDVAKCITAKRFDDAYGLSALAGVYGRYDTQRVADNTAHQAIGVAQMSILGDVTVDQRNELLDVAQRETKNPDAVKAMCDKIRQIGEPSYYPRYMVQHGMGAFFGKNDDGLVKDFDGHAAFERALQDYLHCPVTN